MKKLLRKPIGKILSGLVGFLAVVVLAIVLIQPILFAGFYKDAEKEFKAAGLWQGNVPQGIAYVESKDVFLQVGYKANGKSASCIYVTDGEGENPRAIELMTEDGKPYTGHTGGIAAGEKTVWMANDGDYETGDNGVWVLSLDTLLDENTTQVTLTEMFYPETRSACVSVYEGILWVGEFEDPEKYPTKESHHLTAPDGTENTALICGYAIDESQDNGLVSSTPIAVVSVGSKLQGFVVTRGKIVLSTSYGLAASHLYFHTLDPHAESQGTVTLDGAEVPVWYLDSTTLEKDVTAPPMTEELAVKDGRVYILNESASVKYAFGNIMRRFNVYSLPF